MKLKTKNQCLLDKRDSVELVETMKRVLKESLPMVFAYMYGSFLLWTRVQGRRGPGQETTGVYGGIL